MKKYNIPLNKNRILFFFSFSLSKGIVFLVPLFLADLLSKEDFGILEYALAGVGMLVNSIIDLGASGSYPYFVLKQKNKNIAKGFILHGLWLNVFFTINQILYFSGFYHIEIYMAFNISYVIANQLFYASQLKTHEKINKSVILNSGIYIVLLFFILGSIANLILIDIKTISWGVFSYATFIFLYNLYRFIKVDKEGILNAYLTILKFSIHILISSILLFTITVSGRILTEYFFDFAEVAVYGFYFRLAAVTVMIYQVVVIMFFKKIYTSKPVILDMYFTYFFIFLFVISIFLDFLAPYTVPYFSDFYETTYQENKNLFKILIFQMIMWISTGLVSNIIDREKLAKNNNFRLLVLLSVGIILLFYIGDTLSIEKLTFFIYCFFFMTALIQYYSLFKKNLLFKKSIITIILIYISSIIYIYY